MDEARVERKMLPATVMMSANNIGYTTLYLLSFSSENSIDSAKLG